MKKYTAPFQRKSFYFLAFFSLFLNSCCWAETWEGVPAGYGLTWSDEFNGVVGSQPNTITTWTYETGCGGYGTGNLENNTTDTANSQIVADPSAVDGKALAIIALDPGGNNAVTCDYTSARINTLQNTLNLQNYQYAFYVSRLRMAYGQGIGCGFWMVGANIGTVGWPACGEIDILENIGNASQQGVCNGSLHETGVNLTGSLTLLGGQLFHNDYHTFAVLVQNNDLQYFCDGNLYEQITPSNTGGVWDMNQGDFIVFNLSVGGDWPGAPDATTTFPQTMLVDYVRLYQQGQPTPTPVVSTVWRVSCGGPSYTDSQGNTWVADTNFTGGWPLYTSNAISGTLPDPTDQQLYQYQRWGNNAGGTTITYVFRVLPGIYQATLKFSENVLPCSGCREFNYSINGTTEESNFDIRATAGGTYEAVDKVYSNLSPDANGDIQIQFIPGSKNLPVVDAIEVIQQITPTPTSTFTPCMMGGVPCTSTPTFTNTYTPTVMKTPTSTFTPTATFTPLPKGAPILYPNPAKGVSAVNLQLPLSAVSDVRVQVFTTAFRKVLDDTFTQVAPGTNLSLPLVDAWYKTLANGVYYVKVGIGGKRWTLKMIVLL